MFTVSMKDEVLTGFIEIGEEVTLRLEAVHELL